MFIKNQIFINLPIILIFSIFLITGIIIYDDYGISWDEYFNRINGFVSLNSIRNIFSLDIIYPELVHSTKSFAETAKIYGVIFDLPMAFIEKELLIEDPKIYFLLLLIQQIKMMVLQLDGLDINSKIKYILLIK